MQLSKLKNNNNKQWSLKLRFDFDMYMSTTSSIPNQTWFWSHILKPMAKALLLVLTCQSGTLIKSPFSTQSFGDFLLANRIWERSRVIDKVLGYQWLHCQLLQNDALMLLPHSLRRVQLWIDQLTCPNRNTNSTMSKFFQVYNTRTHTFDSLSDWYDSYTHPIYTRCIFPFIGCSYE